MERGDAAHHVASSSRRRRSGGVGGDQEHCAPRGWWLLRMQFDKTIDYGAGRVYWLNCGWKGFRLRLVVHERSERILIDDGCTGEEYMSVTNEGSLRTSGGFVLAA